MNHWLAGRQVADLSAEELDKLWSVIRSNFTIHLNTVLCGAESAPDQEFFHTLLSLAKQCIDTPEPHVSKELVHIALALGDILLNKNTPQQIQQETADFLVLWCNKGLVSAHLLCVKTFHYLLASSLHKRILVSDVKRLWNFHQNLLNADYQSETFRCLVPLLLRMVQNEPMLSVKEGRCLVAFFLCLNEDLVKEFHRQIKVALPSCRKEVASAYGEIYSLAIKTANPSMKVVVAEVCLRDVILHVLQVPRSGLQMGRMGKQLMHVLRVIHSNRRCVAVTKMLIHAYEPIIWRFVSSCNNIHRSNAAEVLLDVYPLEHPGGCSMKNVNLMELQHATMNRLLMDTCHVVRIIAIRGVCQILCEFWSGIPVRWRHKWMSVLLQDLSTDGSSVQVRCSIYRSLSKLLKNPKAADYLGTALPALYQQIHDNQACVRLSFVMLLLHIKQTGLLQYQKMVPVDHLIARLKVEDQRIGRQLVSLMFSNLLVPKQSMDERVKRIVKLASSSVTATRNFFLYSKHVLEFADAVELMQGLLLHLENTHSESAGVPHLHRSAHVVGGLLDVVSILWSLHTAVLNSSANKGQLMQLYQLVQACLPTLLRCYRECNGVVLGSVLFLGSLVPARVLKECTASSFCISRLRNLVLDGNVEEASLMWVSPLCSWGQGAEVLELAMEWLEEALGTVQTEQLALRRVRFCSRSEPLLALHMLDAVFCHPTNMLSVMTKNRDLVLELWLYLDRIKLAIERRMVGPLTSPLLSDEFLCLCFLRYAKLIVLLGEYPGKTFSSCETLLQLLGWAERVLVPHIPGTLPAEVPLAAKLLNYLTQVAAAAIMTGQTDDTLHVRLAEYTHKLLSTGCALMFVHSVVCVTHWLVEYCWVYCGHADEVNLLLAAIPRLLLDVLLVFRDGHYSQETLALYAENMGAVRAVLSEVLVVTLQYCGGISKMVLDVVNGCADAVVGITMNHIVEVEILKPVKMVRDLPYVAAQLLSVFQQQNVFCTLFLCLMAKRIRTHYVQDPLLVVSTISVLHAAVYNSGKMSIRDLRLAARAAASALDTVRRGSHSSHNALGEHNSDANTVVMLLAAANQALAAILVKLGLR